MDSNGKPYEVLGPRKIRLGPLAKEWAREWGMTNKEMAKHLLAQHYQREGGLIQKQGEN